MLKDTYPEVKKTIVAIALTRKKQGDFFTIIGTGFVIREDGIILTNQHVLDVVNNLPEVVAGGDPFKEVCVLFFNQEEKHMRLIALEVETFYLPSLSMPKGFSYYGSDKLDLAVIELKNVKGMLAVKIFQGSFREGESIATSGFPLGDNALRAPGWIDQLGPTLRSGIISAVLPFNAGSPHALLLDIMLQGGASGSPVFLPSNGEVIGVIDRGLPGTNFSYCIPSLFIKQILSGIELRPELSERAKNKTPIDDWMKDKKVWNQIPKSELNSGV